MRFLLPAALLLALLVLAPGAFGAVYTSCPPAGEHSEDVILEGMEGQSCTYSEAFLVSAPSFTLDCGGATMQATRRFQEGLIQPMTEGQLFDEIVIKNCNFNAPLIADFVDNPAERVELSNNQAGSEPYYRGLGYFFQFQPPRTFLMQDNEFVNTQTGSVRFTSTGFLPHEHWVVKNNRFEEITTLSTLNLLYGRAGLGDEDTLDFEFTGNVVKNIRRTYTGNQILFPYEAKSYLIQDNVFESDIATLWHLYPFIAGSGLTRSITMHNNLFKGGLPRVRFFNYEQLTISENRFLDQIQSAGIMVRPLSAPSQSTSTLIKNNSFESGSRTTALIGATLGTNDAVELSENTVVNTRDFHLSIRENGLRIGSAKLLNNRFEPERTLILYQVTGGGEWLGNAFSGEEGVLWLVGPGGFTRADSTFTVTGNCFRPGERFARSAFHGRGSIGVMGAGLKFYNNVVGADFKGFNTGDCSRCARAISLHTGPVEGPNVVGGPQLGGNYYEDYAGVDGDGDGFGDTPFTTSAWFSGRIFIDDPYPLMFLSEPVCPQEPVIVPNMPPTAAFKAVPREGVVELWVDFDASASTDEDGTIVKYSWDFDGDGVDDLVTTGPHASHEYGEIGPHTVTLTVEDDDRATDAVTQEILAIGSESITVLEVSDAKTGDMATVTLACTKDLSATITVTDSDGVVIVPETAVQCNTQFELGPMINPGVYQAEAKIEKPCNRCDRRDFFSVAQATELDVPDVHPVFAALLALLVLLAVGKK